MSAPTPAAEILIRLNLAAGLSDRERAELSALAAREGGLERALEAALRRGLALREAGGDAREEIHSPERNIS